MAIQLWDPVREAVSLRDVMSSLLQDSFVRPGALLGDGGPAMLPLDISENDNEFIVKASLPGIRPEDVQITVHGDTLTIRGEMKAEQEKKDEHYHLRERRYGVVPAHGPALGPGPHRPGQGRVRERRPDPHPAQVRGGQAQADQDRGTGARTARGRSRPRPARARIRPRPGKAAKSC